MAAVSGLRSSPRLKPTDVISSVSERLRCLNRVNIWAETVQRIDYSGSDYWRNRRNLDDLKSALVEQYRRQCVGAERKTEKERKPQNVWESLGSFLLQNMKLLIICPSVTAQCWYHSMQEQECLILCPYSRFIFPLLFQTSACLSFNWFTWNLCHATLKLSAGPLAAELVLSFSQVFLRLSSSFFVSCRIPSDVLLISCGGYFGSRSFFLSKYLHLL